MYQEIWLQGAAGVGKRGEDVENVLKAQKTALEIAANLCCSEGELICSWFECFK